MNSVNAEFTYVLYCRLLASLSGLHSQALGTTGFLEKHWVQINVEPLSRQELTQIVETMVGNLSSSLSVSVSREKGFIFKF
jgi:hypothetical protein